MGISTEPLQVILRQSVTEESFAASAALESRFFARSAVTMT